MSQVRINENRVRMNHRRGLTLVEMLIVLVMFAIITLASGQAYITSLDYTRRVQASRVNRFRLATFEDRLRNLLRYAYLSSTTTDTNSYFIAGQAGTDSEISANANALLTFTMLPPHIPGALLDGDDTFENLNTRIGPSTGITEVALSSQPSSNEAPVDEGLFLRVQSPADGDLTQGGFESVLTEDVTQISFEFWDGATWLTEWNTQTLTEPRLPGAIRVTYTLDLDDTEHILTVKLFHSDVTAENPANTGGETQ